MKNKYRIRFENEADTTELAPVGQVAPLPENETARIAPTDARSPSEGMKTMPASALTSLVSDWRQSQTPSLSSPMPFMQPAVLPTFPQLPAPTSLWQAERWSSVPTAVQSDGFAAQNPPPGREEVIRLIRDELAALKVYVVESEITAAQNAVKSVVELSSY